MPFEVRDEGGRSRVRVHGRWTVAEAGSIDATQGALPSGSRALVFDASAIEALDLSGAWRLWELESGYRAGGGRVSWTPSRPDLLAFIDQTMAGEPEAPAQAGPARTGLEGALQDVGQAAVQVKEGALDLLGFVGVVTAGVGHIFGSVKRLRLPSVVRHVYETGLTAVPIVSLIAFLIAVIVAYIGAQQLRKFGGEIFVVDLVTVSVLRELGVLLTAIIVAGRSGSAFTAEIGTMKVNEEVDALSTMGLQPTRFLVVPRVLAGIVMAPLLTIYFDLVALVGAAVVVGSFGHGLVTFVHHVQNALTVTMFVSGMIKTFAFGLIIAGIGCQRGLDTGTGAVAVGLSTTRSVVAGILLTILADGVFAGVYFALGI